MEAAQILRVDRTISGLDSQVQGEGSNYDLTSSETTRLSKTLNSSHDTAIIGREILSAFQPVIHRRQKQQHLTRTLEGVSSQQLAPVITGSNLKTIELATLSPRCSRRQDVLVVNYLDNQLPSSPKIPRIVGPCSTKRHFHTIMARIETPMKTSLWRESQQNRLPRWVHSTQRQGKVLI